MTDNDNGSDTKATSANILEYVSNEIVGKHMVDLGDSVLVTTILVEMGKLDLQQKNRHPNDAAYCFQEVTGGYEVDEETKRITKLGVLTLAATTEGSNNNKELPYDLIRRLTFLVDQPVKQPQHDESTITTASTIIPPKKQKLGMMMKPRDDEYIL